MEVTSIFIAVVVLILLFLITSVIKNNVSVDDRNLPPGPTGLPLIGCLADLKPTLFAALHKYGKKYGPIFRIQLGTKQLIILNSFEAVKEALVNQGKLFDGRPQDKFFHRTAQNEGLIHSDGEKWKRQRRTALRILKDFGFGRDGSKEVIQNEIEDVMKILDSQLGTPVETQKLFGNCTANVINAISVNERPAYTDENFQKVLDCFDKMVKLSYVDFLPLFFPFLLKVPYLIKLMPGSGDRSQMSAICFNYIKSKIKAHKQTFDIEQEPKDFIDAMLVLEQEAKQEPDYSPETYEFRIQRTIFELFIAGNDTTATALTWYFLLLALHPKVQQQVQREIDLVCDSNSPIRIDHKKSMPYTSAVLDEVMRVASIVPTSVMHRVKESTIVLGFVIPKDTIIVPHLYSVHHDANYWRHPEEFYPERFLDSDGKYKADEHLIPFSLGPRTCMGEILATMEFFLISTSLIRKYKVSLDGQLSPKEIETLLMGNNGGVRRLNRHELLFTHRNSETLQ